MCGSTYGENKYLNFIKLNKKNLILYLLLLPCFVFVLVLLLLPALFWSCFCFLLCSGPALFWSCFPAFLLSYITFLLAREGFDPPTFGLWAQHASSAPPRYFFCVVSLFFLVNYFCWFPLCLKDFVAEIGTSDYNV